MRSSSSNAISCLDNRKSGKKAHGRNGHDDIRPEEFFRGAKLMSIERHTQENSIFLHYPTRTALCRTQLGYPAAKLLTIVFSYTRASYNNIKSHFASKPTGHSDSKYKNQDILTQALRLEICNSSRSVEYPPCPIACCFPSSSKFCLRRFLICSTSELFV